MASNLTVIVFDNMEEADKVHDSHVCAKKQGFTSIDDSAVIVKDEYGKVHVTNLPVGLCGRGARQPAGTPAGGHLIRVGRSDAWRTGWRRHRGANEHNN